MSKISMAREVLNDSNLERKEAVQLLMDKLEFSKPMAHTYVSMILGATDIKRPRKKKGKKVAAKAPRKTTTKVKKVVEPKLKYDAEIIKDINLQTMKEVSARISKYEKQDREIRKQFEKDNRNFGDAKDFVPKFLLKKLDRYVE
jgi:hypothetical protein